MTRVFTGSELTQLSQNFLPEPPQINKVKLSEARVFAQKLMAEAASKTPLINPHAAIGTNLNETILRFK